MIKIKNINEYHELNLFFTEFDLTKLKQNYSQPPPEGVERHSSAKNALG